MTAQTDLRALVKLALPAARRASITPQELNKRTGRLADAYVAMDPHSLIKPEETDNSDPDNPVTIRGTFADPKAPTNNEKARVALRNIRRNMRSVLKDSGIATKKRTSDAEAEAAGEALAADMD